MSTNHALGLLVVLIIGVGIVGLAAIIHGIFND